MKTTKEKINEAIVKGKLKQYSADISKVYYSSEYKFYGVLITSLEMLDKIVPLDNWSTYDRKALVDHFNDNGKILIEPQFAQFLYLKISTGNFKDGVNMNTLQCVENIRVKDINYDYWNKKNW